MKTNYVFTPQPFFYYLNTSLHKLMLVTELRAFFLKKQLWNLLQIYKDKVDNTKTFKTLSEQVTGFPKCKI